MKLWMSTGIVWLGMSTWTSITGCLLNLGST